MHSEEISVESILEKAKDAMGAASRFEIVNGKNVAVIYQKTLTNGLSVTRVEVPGKKQMVMLDRGEQSFYLFPFARLAVNVTKMKNDMFKQLQSGATRSLSAMFDNASPATASLNGVVVVDSHVCYEVESIFAPDLIANLVGSLPEDVGVSIPDKVVYFIETNDFKVIKSQNELKGSVISETHYRSYSDLPSDSNLFEIPKDYRIEVVKNEDEYAVALRNFVIAKPRLIKGYALDPKTGLVVKIDPVTGAFIQLGDPNSIRLADEKMFAKSSKIRAAVIALMAISTIVFLFIFARRLAAQKK